MNASTRRFHASGFCASKRSPLWLFERAGRLSTVFGMAAAVGLALPAMANPGVMGGQVVAGSATINQNGSTTTINAANNTIINYQSFNVGAGQTVRFVQPSASSRVLNRVTGSDPSTIAGTIQSNGIVYIANPAGVFFANGALVDVGGIYAAAGRISNADFLNNVNRFTLSGTVENHGMMMGREVHLLGQRAANFGTIVAPQGMVTMSAGDEVLIGATGGQIMARVSTGGTGGDTGVTQAGQITAEGGRIAIGAGDMYALAIDHRGSSRAAEVTLEGGRGGVVSVAGTVDASSASGSGGTVRVLGEKVGIMDARIDASGATGGGTVLVGGNKMGQGAEQNARAVYVSPDATISADAVEGGKGGTVIVWSDEVSRVYGSISARGGERGGEGGFVETSSARELVVTRTPDVTARSSASRGGTWLIDPEDLTIVAGDGSNNINTTPPPPASIFESSGSGAELGVDLIVQALTGGANVEVRTGATGPAEGGTILLHADADLDYSGTGENTLSLIAHRDIILNGRIFSAEGGGDVLNVHLMADSDGNGTGNVHFNNLFETGGGLLTVSGVEAFFGATSAVNTSGGDITLDVTDLTRLYADVQAGTGDITFNSDVRVAADVTLGANDVTFNGRIDSQGSGAFGLTIETVEDGDTRFNDEVGFWARLAHLNTNDDGRTVIDAPYVRAAVIDFDNPVLLQQDTHILGTTSLRFGQTVDSPPNLRRSLRFTSPRTTFHGVVGNNQGGRLGDFVAEGGTGTSETVLHDVLRATTVTTASNNNLRLQGGTINTIFDQVYNGRLIVAEDATLSAGTVSETGNITFNGLIDSIVTDRTLVVETSQGGTTRFNANVGANTPLRELRINADGVTILGGGSVTTSGAQVYFNPVILEGNSSITANTVRFHSTVDSGAEARSLSVNPGHLATFDGAVGSTSPLSTLSLGSGGTAHFNGGSVTTTGVQAYNGAVRIGAHSTFTGSSITFSRALDSETNIFSLAVETSGGGHTTFNGAVGSHTPLAGITVGADGITRILGPSVVTTGDQTYNNAVELGASSTFTGVNIAFLSTVNSTALLSEGALTVNASGQTIFGGPVGGIQPLRSITTNAAGTTHIGADITTTGRMTFGDPVVLVGDAVLNSTTAAGGIAFRGAVNSDGTARALTLLVDSTSNATAEDPVIARIAFGSDVGHTSPLRTLTLGGNRSTNPTLATIVGGLSSTDTPITNFSMFITTTDGFRMGELQKFTVLGDLTINAGTSAVLGDISAARSITVNSPDIAIRTRPGGQMLVREGSGLVMRNDPAVDFVAGQNITFSTTPRLIGEHARPAFGTPQAGNISATLVDFPQRAVGPVSVDMMRLGTAYVDLRAAGPGNNNVAEAIAGAVPRADNTSAPDEVALGSGQLEELARLGIQASAEEDESLPFVSRTVHDDTNALLATDTRITSRRLPPGATAQVLASYRALFYGEGGSDADFEARAAHISRVLGEAWREYSDAAGRRADPVGFRAYCEAVPAQAEALHYLNGLRDLFTQMGYMGLTPAEVRGARQEIIRALTFPGLSASQLETAIMATYLGAARPQSAPAATMR